jgi:hypothetical protein
MSYGKYMLERPPISTEFLSIYAGETSGVFVVIPSIYHRSGVVYVRENSSLASMGKPIYKIRFRLKDRKP